MSAVNTRSIFSGLWEFHAAIHFSATAASRSVVDLPSRGAAIAAGASRANSMAINRLRFRFTFIFIFTPFNGLEAGSGMAGSDRQRHRTLRDCSKVAKERKHPLARAWEGLLV